LLLFLALPLFGQVVDHGIAVDFSAKRGAATELSFRLSDTATHTPLTGIRPAGWLALRQEGRPAKDCTRQAATYLAGDLFARADVDLNNYFVVALNDDDSLSVVDPLFGFGGSKLLAMVDLPGRGEDWVLAPDQSSLYVSIPTADKVAVVDTRTWQVTRTIATGPHPRRLVYHHQLFVADDEGVTTESGQRLHLGRVGDLAVGEGVVYAATVDGVVAIDARPSPALRAPSPRFAGRGRLAIELPSPRFAGRGRLVIELPSPRVSGEKVAEGRMRGLAYSGAAKRVYALTNDSVVTEDGTRIAVDPGATTMRFAPNGRYALIANPERNRVQVLDAATNRIIQNADIPDGPDQITFTDLLAYVRRRGSEIVLTIPLAQLGAEGKPLNVADFPGGQHSFGEGVPSLADSIVESPDGPSVLVANAADKMIYLYKEGMAAPMGGFSNYGRQPRAALVVDRGLREGAAGTYATAVPVTKPGLYDVIFFLDSPRVVACFAMEVPDTEPKKPATRVAAIAPPRVLKSGEPTTLRFALVDPASRKQRRADDVRALAFEAPGVWQQRGEATALADGTYQFTFVPPSSGTYYLFVESESLGLARGSGQFLVYEAQ
jgi:YVTN family beta-propeller protein